MSELETKINDLIESQLPATFEQWVKSRNEGDQELIHEGLDFAYHTSSYRPAYRVVSELADNPWRGGIDAMRNYAIRRQRNK